MKNLTHAFSRTLLLLALIGVAGPLAAQPAVAPAFTVTGAAGQEIQFPGELEQPTVLLIWATWCPYCKGLMPHLQSLVDEYGSEGIRVIAVSAFEQEGDPVAYVAKQGYQFQVVEQGEAIAKKYGVKGVPGVFLVHQGEVRWHLGLARQAEQRTQGVKGHGRRAVRRAPFWAAELRKALDTLE
ncbi:MAG: TlpA disulfide reductase family protein [Pseudomonadota bacterium]